MKIQVFSDTHRFHEQFIVQDGVDMLIHAGDFSNAMSRSRNVEEVKPFLEWYDNLKVKHKVLIAGNHDTSIEAKMISPEAYKSITYLEHESVEIEGIRIFGSPYTPSFGVGWSFNKDRSKLQAYWDDIPSNTDIVVVHGPPYGVLDLSYNMAGVLEFCGCRALLNRMKKIQPKYCVFGHIHNNEDNENSGTRTISGYPTVYINASCVQDGRFDKGLTSNGTIINYDNT